MNSDFVLVLNEDSKWYGKRTLFWGSPGWNSSVERAHVYATREAAEKAIKRMEKRGVWEVAKVKYVTLDELDEQGLVT